jgi:hypothetical protein
MKLREAILEQFEPDIAVSLIEFGKSLSRVNADFLIFMARKSLCLYDVLLRLGIPPVERCVVSDRVLDMRLDALEGKRLALIDDTLIVGTTLAKAKRRLETEAKATVTVHVFCVDQKWWCKDLVRPDSIALQLDDTRVMTFCTAEVRALSLAPRPYLVDFPLSRPIRVRLGDTQCLLSSVDWTSCTISTKLQERHGVRVFSFFPTDDILSELAAGLGEHIASCLDIVKVRAFARKAKEVYWLQLVPIVTLKPLSKRDLEVLVRTMLERVSASSGKDLSRTLYFAHTPLAQQRLAQYLLSAAVGERFVRSLASSIAASIEGGYDEQETDRHYGPWLHDELAEATKCAFRALWPESGTSSKFIFPPVTPVKLPSSVRRLADESLRGVNLPLRTSREEYPNRIDRDTLNLVTEFTEVFLRLYDTREIPARLEAQRLGPRVLDATPEEAPNRDRLEIGIPWGSILEHFSRRCRIQTSLEKVSLFSLVLDLCNDMGIAVPITCERAGVVFRAYRHGEDVKFSDGELSLAYETAKGLLESSGREGIPHLVLEKLLILLIRIGAATGFLEPLYGRSGVEGTVRVGFDLKGARPILIRGPKDRADRDIWLSRYLLKRGVLRLNANRQYVLGTPVDGNYLVNAAPERACEIGNMVGWLWKSSKDPTHASAPLDDKNLIILTTCWPPRDAAGALQVELDIFREWYDESGRSALSSVRWDNPKSIDECLKLLLRSNGYEAIQAAGMKYVGYRTAQYQEIIAAGAKFLAQNLPIELPSRTWRSYWKAVNATQYPAEKATFDPLIDRAASRCWEVAACLSTLELALCGRSLSLLTGTKSPAFKHALEKLRSYDQSMTLTGLARPTLAASLLRRFQEMEKRGPLTFDHQIAFQYGLEHIEQRIPLIASLVEAMSPTLEEFGRLYARHDYRYMLYYDIIDSSGAKAGRTGKDLEAYRARVRSFKDFINGAFHRLSITARKKLCEIYCWNGNKSSTNDSKHVFLSGSYARGYVGEVVRTLLLGTRACADICLRIYVVPCNFAGTGAYRREANTEVEGERFWEHWSRFSEACSSFEQGCESGTSFLLVGTDELIGRFNPPEGTKWIDPKDGAVSSEIEGLTRSTKVRHGAIFAV